MSIYYKESPEDFERSLISIFSSSIIPSEIVLVKDGPLSKELDLIINQYNDLYKNVFKIITFKENRGLGVALNRGLLECNNELVARMDTDDICAYDRFEKQLIFMHNNPEISVLGGGIAEFSENPNSIDGYRRPPTSSREICKYLKYRCPFNHMTVMFRRSDVKFSGNYQDFFHMEDYYLWLRMFLDGFLFANLPDTLVNAKAGSGMLSRRGGRKYAQSEKKLLTFMYEKKIINYYEFCILLISKTSVRLIHPNIRGLLYKIFLRE